MTTDRTLVQQRLKDGTRVSIRAIRSGDEAGSAAFIEALSPSSKHFLFLGGVPSMSADALQRLCAPREGQDMALVAFEDEHPQRLIGVARYAGATPKEGAEISIAVADEWQHKGLGTLLLQRLVEHARSRGVCTLYSMDSASNSRMRTLAKHFGFTERADPADIRQVMYTLKIAPGATSASSAPLQTL